MVGRWRSGTRGVLNDAISIYFADATLAGAFVTRWCVGSKVETAGGVFQVREDEPAHRIGPGYTALPNLLLSRQLPSPGYSRSSGSSRQPVKAVGKV